MSVYIIIKWRWWCKSSCICGVAGCCCCCCCDHRHHNCVLFFLACFKKGPFHSFREVCNCFFSPWFYRKLDLGTKNVFHLNI